MYTSLSYLLILSTAIQDVVVYLVPRTNNRHIPEQDRSDTGMIPQLPSRNRTPRRREHTGGSTSSTFLASESSFNHSHSHSHSQSGKPEYRKESITYKHEWRIEDVSQLAAHVEGFISGEEREEGQESPSEILRSGRKTADEMYKFDLGTSSDVEWFGKRRN
jgi:hypothetical protein